MLGWVQPQAPLVKGSQVKSKAEDNYAETLESPGQSVQIMLTEMNLMV